jgi:phosphatidylglycerol lysyltransferase
MSHADTWIKRLSGGLGVLIFAVALYFVHHMAKQYSWQQIADALTSLPARNVVYAFISTFLSYAVLTLYDVLALQYLGKTISSAKTILTSFIAFSLTNNIGLANLAGNSVRLRMYSAFGYSAKEILTIVVFISFSFWTGFLGLTGALFLLAPPEIPGTISLSSHWLRLLGLFLVAVPIGYFLVCLFRWTPGFMRRFQYDLPSWKVAVLQIIVSAVEWALAALALFVLLPSANNAGGFWEFLSIFGMAQFLSLLSHVPGGLGVLEATVIYFISPDEQPAAAALGGLLAFRLIYYFLPLVLSLAGWLIFEVRQKRKKQVAATSIRR